jgi:hypothetical protein
MSDSAKKPEQSPDDTQSEYVKGGKGRKDEVGKSGIYPASFPDAPGDAVIREEGDLGAHTRSPSANSSGDGKA